MSRLVKREFTLWYYLATAVGGYGGSEEVEITIDSSIPLAAQSDRFDPVILENSPTLWYMCKVLDGWGCGDPDEETVVYTYYRTS